MPDTKRGEVVPPSFLASMLRPGAAEESKARTKRWREKGTLKYFPLELGILQTHQHKI